MKRFILLLLAVAVTICGFVWFWRVGDIPMKGNWDPKLGPIATNWSWLWQAVVSGSMLFGGAVWAYEILTHKPRRRRQLRLRSHPATIRNLDQITRL